MGELASVSANLLFLHLYDKHNYNEFAIQKIINTVASSSDLIADIDAYVISHYFETHLQNGMRVSEILNEYYNNSKYLATRFMIFAQKIGLKNWNGEHFENELIWLNYYKKQLKYNIAFQFYSLIKLDVENFFIILNIWANGYKDILLKEELLNSFLFSLKKCIKLGY